MLEAGKKRILAERGLIFNLSRSVEGALPATNREVIESQEKNESRKTIEAPKSSATACPPVFLRAGGVIRDELERQIVAARLSGKPPQSIAGFIFAGVGEENTGVYEEGGRLGLELIPLTCSGIMPSRSPVMAISLLRGVISKC